MKIDVRLFATLRAFLPPGSSRAGTGIDVPMGSSISDVLARLAIPPEQAALVLINGRYEADRHCQLNDGCVLSIWPQVAGG